MDPTTLELASAAPVDHVTDYVNAFRAGQAIATPTVGGDPISNAITGQPQPIDPTQKAQAARRAELLGAIGVGLSGVPYPQRPSILAHLAPALEQEGIPSQVVASFDPTDEALFQSIDQARAASGLLNAS